MKETGLRNAAHGADKFGLKDLGAVHWNLTEAPLYEHAIRNGDMMVSHACVRGEHRFMLWEGDLQRGVFLTADAAKRAAETIAQMRGVASRESGKSLGKVPDEFKHLAGTKPRESA